MQRRRLGTLLPLLGALVLGPLPTFAEAQPHVRLETTAGNIVVELDAERAPATVENFLGYVRDGFYDGLIFHRVIEGFMIQGGGLGPDMRRRPTKAPIRNESANGLENERGTLAMARTSDPHSATAQFFINVVDNPFLDRARAGDGWGYAVFGRVVEGMDVVDAIRGVPTTRRGGRGDVPVDPIVINRALVLGSEPTPTKETPQ